MRGCARLLVSRLPADVGEWIESADAYERGSLSAGELMAVRLRAWHFHDARRGSAGLDELSGLRVVMYRLWPESETADWYESAVHLIRFCNEAGLGEGQLLGLLQEHFAGLIGEADAA